MKAKYLQYAAIIPASLGGSLMAVLAYDYIKFLQLGQEQSNSTTKARSFAFQCKGEDVESSPFSLSIPF